MLQSYTIEDDLALADRMGIDVTVELTDGRLAWCFFMTPSALADAGDWVQGTEVRVHLGVPHMIVVSEISADIIDRILRQLDADSELLEHVRIEIPGRLEAEP
jgi:hypothetical protein